MMPMPRRLRLPHDVEQAVDLGRLESADVGSSMMMSRASIDSARAISTICWSATLRSRTSRRGSIFEAEPVERRARLRASWPAS